MPVGEPSKSTKKSRDRSKTKSLSPLQHFLSGEMKPHRVVKERRRKRKGGEEDMEQPRVRRTISDPPLRLLLGSDCVYKEEEEKDIPPPILHVPFSPTPVVPPNKHREGRGLTRPTNPTKRQYKRSRRKDGVSGVGEEEEDDSLPLHESSPFSLIQSHQDGLHEEERDNKSSQKSNVAKDLQFNKNYTLPSNQEGRGVSQAEENDRIVQQKLREAKAQRNTSRRKGGTGAVMHSFSLWDVKKNNKDGRDEEDEKKKVSKGDFKRESSNPYSSNSQNPNQCQLLGRNSLKNLSSSREGDGQKKSKIQNISSPSPKSHIRLNMEMKTPPLYPYSKHSLMLSRSIKGSPHQPQPQPQPGDSMINDGTESGSLTSTSSMDGSTDVSACELDETFQSRNNSTTSKKDEDERIRKRRKRRKKKIREREDMKKIRSGGNIHNPVTKSRSQSSSAYFNRNKNYSTNDRHFAVLQSPPPSSIDCVGP